MFRRSVRPSRGNILIGDAREQTFTWLSPIVCEPDDFATLIVVTNQEPPAPWGLAYEDIVHVPSGFLAVGDFDGQFLEVPLSGGRRSVRVRVFSDYPDLKSFPPADPGLLDCPNIATRPVVVVDEPELGAPRQWVLEPLPALRDLPALLEEWVNAANTTYDLAELDSGELSSGESWVSAAAWSGEGYVACDVWSSGELNLCVMTENWGPTERTWAQVEDAQHVLSLLREAEQQLPRGNAVMPATSGGTPNPQG